MFVCETCGCVDRASATNFYTRKTGEPAQCSACDPDIARWHGFFPRRQYDPAFHTGRIWRDGEWRPGRPAERV